MIYDLTRILVSGMPVYPGDPEVQIVAGGAPPWRVSALHLGSHSGTHVDAPLHYFADGRGINAFPPERFVARGSSSMPAGMPKTPRLAPTFSPAPISIRA